MADSNAGASFWRARGAPWTANGRCSCVSRAVTTDMFDGNGDGNPAELWRHAMN